MTMALSPSGRWMLPVRQTACDSRYSVCGLCALQANAVSDKILDLRMCDFTGKNLSGKVLSGALLKEATLLNSNLREVVLTKVCTCSFTMSMPLPRDILFRNTRVYRSQFSS